MKRTKLVGIFSIVVFLVLICLFLWVTTDYTTLNGVVHVDSEQQYVSTEQFCMGSGDYKLPKKYENFYKDGQTVICKLSVQKYIFTNSTRYELIEVDTIN